MAYEQKPSPEKEPGHSDAPPPGTEGEYAQDKPKSEAKTDNCRYIKQELPHVIVNVPAPIVNIQQPPEKDKWTIANRIAFWSILVTITLIVVTYQLFKEARRQSDATIIAANAAVSADSINVIAFDRDSVRYAIASINDSLRFVKQFMLADSTYKRSVAEGRERFRIENSALQAQIASLDSAQKTLKLKICHSCKYPIRDRIRWQ